jgi:hypothetical protein
VPSMNIDSRSESLLASLIEAKASEAQGRRREAGSERSVERKPRADEQELPMRRQGRTSGPMTAKSKSIKARQRRGSGSAVKIGGLTSGDLDGVSSELTWLAVRPTQCCPEVSRGRSSDEGRESRLERRPERCARVGTSKQRTSNLQAAVTTRGQPGVDKTPSEPRASGEAAIRSPWSVLLARVPVLKERPGRLALRPSLRRFTEPPDADPHVRWCRRESP